MLGDVIEVSKSKVMTKKSLLKWIFSFIIMTTGVVLILWVLIGFGNYMPSRIAKGYVKNLEYNYLYQDAFTSDTYKQEKAKIMESRFFVSKVEFEKFIQNTTALANDKFTFINYDNIFGKMKYSTSIARRHNLTSEMIGDNVLKIKFDSFTSGLTASFKKELDQHPEAEYLIIDLRNNGGGATREALGIADDLLSSGEMFRSQKLREDFRYYADEEHYSFKKLFIWLNKDSGSASEVLTLALKTNLGDQVVLIGKETYKKGVGQNIDTDEKLRLEFAVVSQRWSVNDKTVEDIEYHLTPYLSEAVQLKVNEDYLRETKKLIL